MANVNDIPDEELLRRVVRNARAQHGRRPVPGWMRDSVMAAYNDERGGGDLCDAALIDLAEAVCRRVLAEAPSDEEWQKARQG